VSVEIRGVVRKPHDKSGRLGTTEKNRSRKDKNRRTVQPAAPVRFAMPVKS
jgi:hypothetical protein